MVIILVGVGTVVINQRVCTRAQNGWNAKKMGGRSASSKYKGVSYMKNSWSQKRWRVRVGTKYIGLFATELEAAQAYELEAKKTYGEFARV